MAGMTMEEWQSGAWVAEYAAAATAAATSAATRASSAAVAAWNRWVDARSWAARAALWVSVAARAR